MDDRDWTHKEALDWLSRWGLAYRRRDEVIRKAFTAGVTKAEICRRMGLAKTTVTRVLESR